MTQQAPSPFIRFLARAVKSVRNAGLPRDPGQRGKDGAKAPERDWEAFGHDLAARYENLRMAAGLMGDRPWNQAGTI